MCQRGMEPGAAFGVTGAQVDLSAGAGTSAPRRHDGLSCVGEDVRQGDGQS